MTHESLIADEMIAHELKPHAEGAWFRETFRDAEGHEGRAHSTAILFLLKAGEVSRWHRVDADELFHWYGGVPLVLESRTARRGTNTSSDQPARRRAPARAGAGRRVANRAQPRCLGASRLVRLRARS
jgi:predicted cupin superfamily sugar epimerase